MALKIIASLCTECAGQSDSPRRVPVPAPWRMVEDSAPAVRRIVAGRLPVAP